MPDTLQKIENRTFYDHLGVTGELAIPAAVESIGTTAFNAAQISAIPPLPQSLETIGSLAFEEAFASAAGPSLSNFVIPANVRSVGNNAFGSTVFSGTLTIRSPHLTRTPADTARTRTGSLGSSIFTEGGAAAVTQEFTKIVIPRRVFISYTQADLNAIFGPAGSSRNGRPCLSGRNDGKK